MDRKFKLFELEKKYPLKEVAKIYRNGNLLSSYYNEKLLIRYINTKLPANIPHYLKWKYKTYMLDLVYNEKELISLLDIPNSDLKNKRYLKDFIKTSNTGDIELFYNNNFKYIYVINITKSKDYNLRQKRIEEITKAIKDLNYQLKTITKNIREEKAELLSQKKILKRKII